MSADSVLPAPDDLLRASEARFRALIENSTDITAIVGSDGLIQYISPSCRRGLGYAPDALVGRLIFQVLHPEDGRSVLKGWAQLMQMPLGVTSPSVEVRINHADGSWHVHEAVISNLTADPHIQGIAVNLRDITERKLAEAEREKLVRELETKNQELERFNYTVSHDLKSPLITIRGFLGFIEKDARSGNLERLAQDVTRVSNATDKMLSLLDDLLALSRIGGSRRPLQEIPFEEIVREALAHFQARFTERGIRMEVAEDLPVVMVEKTTMVEALQQILDNAIKFMGGCPNPQISIGSRGLDDAGHWLLYIQDNGSGIEAEYHERIFGLFEKLNSQTEGTGIGLTLVRRILEAHAGKVWVESAGKGQGSTFLLTLPQIPYPHHLTE
jgi:PAS domain S-box-containing protein